MSRPRFAIPSFPGSNGEVDNLQTLTRCGFDAFLFRWNDSRELLKDVDGYFFGAGFSYEDRGRSGMVAARDPLFQFLHEEAARGKVIIGNCNGAQVLVESGLIPLGDKLRMCLAHNVAKFKDGSHKAVGFLNEWVWITPACKKGRCATADWKGTMHIPYAHGEGRFVTVDSELLAELKANDQIAFQYCSEQGDVSDLSPITPNGSINAIAGICNREGNVVALMPHPERTPLGDAYFLSIQSWLHAHPIRSGAVDKHARHSTPIFFPDRASMPTELFIDTIITNNEERTVEQAARRIEPKLTLKQYRFVGLQKDRSKELLSSLQFFNPNKEIAYGRTNGEFFRWNSDTKVWEEPKSKPLSGISLLRRDLPDAKGEALGQGTVTGIVYDCRDISESSLLQSALSEVFSNPHASTLEKLVK